jgi:hypothetical protein
MYFVKKLMKLRVAHPVLFRLGADETSPTA